MRGPRTLGELRASDLGPEQSGVVRRIAILWDVAHEDPDAVDVRRGEVWVDARDTHGPVVLYWRGCPG